MHTDTEDEPLNSFGSASDIQSSDTGFGSALKSKDDAEISAEQAAEIVLRKADILSQSTLNSLVNLLSEHLAEREGRELTLLEEIAMNKRITNGLRAEVFTPGGALQTGKSQRDAKEVVSTINAMLKTIGEMEEQAYNQERMRFIESAMADALKELPEVTQEAFFARLEYKLITLQEVEHGSNEKENYGSKETGSKEPTAQARAE